MIVSGTFMTGRKEKRGLEYGLEKDCKAVQLIPTPARKLGHYKDLNGVIYE